MLNFHFFYQYIIVVIAGAPNVNIKLFILNTTFKQLNMAYEYAPVAPLNLLK